MATYRINGVKYNPANWAMLEKAERAACARFAAARERELNTIETTEHKCNGGPFDGATIELQSMCSAPIHVGAWVGHYQGSAWVGTDGGKPVNTHGESTQQKAAPEATGQGFDQLRDLLADLAEDPAEREKTISMRNVSITWPVGAADDFGDFITGEVPTHCNQSMELIRVTGRGKNKQRVYAFTTQPGHGTGFMDDFGKLTKAPATRTHGANFPRAIEQITHAIGRTRYTINATPEAAAKLRARILKAKKWFADKVLNAPKKPTALQPVADAVAELAPVAPVADKTDLATLALIATGRCGGSKETQYRKAGLLKTARDGWTDITEKGERLLLANGYALGPKGWALIAPTAPVPTPAEAVAALVADAVAAVAIDAAQTTARADELAEPEWSKKWAADMADTMAQIEAMKAEREEKRLQRTDAVAGVACMAEACADGVACMPRAEHSGQPPSHTTTRAGFATPGSGQPSGTHAGSQSPAPRAAVGNDSPRWQAYAGDISASLAVSAFNGVSFSPERRGASAQNDYAQTMASDHEKLHAQAVKGGTLHLLPEVFARYRARQAGAFRAYLASSSRCVSSFIAGPANFPAARMNKRADIAHKRLTEYLDGGAMAMQAACRTLRPDLRAIMSGDIDAIDRLTVKIEAAERAQAGMKAANKAIRTHAKAGEAHQVAALMALGFSEAQAVELLHPRFSRVQGFASFSLTNNNANIRRMRERLEQISKAQATEVKAHECANGVTLEDDAPANRVRLYFPGKPSEAIRDELKSSGFRWAPSVGAWQAYRNTGTLATAKRLAGEPLADVAEPIPQTEENRATPTAPESEGARIRAAADKMRARFPEIAKKYDNHALSHDLKDEREARNASHEAHSMPLVPHAHQEPIDIGNPTCRGKSGKWAAWLRMTWDNLHQLAFMTTPGEIVYSTHDTGGARMAALQRLARVADATQPATPATPTATAADAPTHEKAPTTTHTPPTSAAAAQATPPVCAACAPDYTHPVETLGGDYTHPVETLQQAGSVDATTPSQPRHPRNIVPRGGLHIVEDAFEAWTFHQEKTGRFGFVMYLGKQSKPYAYYAYATEAKRDAGFERHAQQARDILASKAKRKAEDRAKLDAGHGLQVGDVVRSSWGYDQTNVDHYQIIKVIGKRTVEVRALAVHEESTGDMSGRVAPVWGEFVGDVMRRQVDKYGNVNMLSASYGRASKIEPVAVVHGVRCYAASHYSSYA